MAIMGTYSNWYDNNKENPVISFTDGIFDNLILIPQRKSRFLGMVRFFGFMSLMLIDPFGLILLDTFWIIPFALICLIEMGIGVIQMMGLHWGKPQILGREYIVEEIPSSGNYVDPTMDEYRYIKNWFSYRDYHLSQLPGSQQAKFFVETGALTEDSVREMSKHRHTRNALSRLDYELSQRTPKEQIEFLRGYK